MHDAYQNVDQSEGRLVLECYQAKYIFESFLSLLKQKKSQCFWMNWLSILQDKRKAASFGLPCPLPCRITFVTHLCPSLSVCMGGRTLMS